MRSRGHQPSHSVILKLSCVNVVLVYAKGRSGCYNLLLTGKDLLTLNHQPQLLSPYGALVDSSPGLPIARSPEPCVRPQGGTAPFGEQRFYLN